MPEECGKHCGEIATDRIRYFTGRYMTARDFRDEQTYFQSRRHLHNRILHGWGVVCGLYVYPDPDSNCAKDHVAIKPGIALDCCGREVVVPLAVKSPRLHLDHKPKDDAAGEESAWYALLCLHYRETDIECAPVLYNECNCNEQRSEYSRVREGYALEWHWVRIHDLHSFGWKTPHGGCGEAAEHDDCDESAEHSHASCIDPPCPPRHCIPLALIRLKPGAPIGKDEIDTAGRPVVRPPRETLTHVCAINWRHGHDIPIRELMKHDGKLKISFDRKLKETPDERYFDGTGVNESTFLVQQSEGSEDLHFVPCDGTPHLTESGRVAVFKIAKGHREPFSYLDGRTVYITLKCDFVLDCHGHAVDGDHLRGLLPSGDDVQGGTFESWFRVISDEKWERRQREYENAASSPQTGAS